MGHSGGTTFLASLTGEGHMLEGGVEQSREWWEGRTEKRPEETLGRFPNCSDDLTDDMW